MIADIILSSFGLVFLCATLLYCIAVITGGKK
jgi:hypothetical protein